MVATVYHERQHTLTRGKGFELFTPTKEIASTPTDVSVEEFVSTSSLTVVVVCGAVGVQDSAMKFGHFIAEGMCYLACWSVQVAAT